MADQAQNPGQGAPQPHKVPVPTLQPFRSAPGEGGVEIREWLPQLDLYVRFLGYNRGGAPPLTDAMLNDIAVSHLGAEGFRTFSKTPEYQNIGQITHNDFRNLLIQHFGKRASTYRARWDFSKRLQEPGEPVSDFLSCLRILVPDCHFPEAYEEEALTTQLILGSRDQRAKRDLLSRAGILPLADAVAFLQASESALQDSTAISNSGQSDVNFMRNRGFNGRGRGTPTQPPVKCRGCGSMGHQQGPSCPARGRSCLKCGIKNHFQSECRQPTPSRGQARGRPFKGPNRRGRGATQGIQVDTNDLQVTNARLSDNTHRAGDGLIRATFYIADGTGTGFYPMSFMVDSGANVSVMSKDSYESYFSHLKLQPPVKTIRCADGSNLQGCMGSFKVKLSFGGRIHVGTFHVVSSRTEDLIGTDFLRPLKVNIQFSNDSVNAVAVTLPDLLKEYPKLTEKSMGTYKGSAHKIQIREDAVPVAVPLRQIPLARREAAIKEVEKMDQLGIWEPVDHSEWAHPLVTVPKKDNSVRITSDLTRLNKYIIPDRYPLPRIKDLCLNLAGSTVFSKLDAEKGYFHIPLHKDSRDLTTTLTPLGLRRYLRLPMGLKDSASAFQKRMHDTLRGLEGVEVYIDDIIVHGRTQEEHDRRLRAALKRLEAADFRLQTSKVLLSKDTIPAFGFILSKDGIRPDPANIKPILETPKPQSTKDLQRFLGMVNYFQDFVRDATSLAEPLRKLTRKDQEFVWDQEQDLAFRTLKAAVAEETLLQIFDPMARTFVTTDASDIGIGALLSQISPATNKEVPIAFFNKTLDPAERNYAANEREALACMLACEHWEHLLLGRQFTLRTDHQALTSILSHGKDRRQTSKFLRWKERLEAFDFILEYIPGPHNAVADYLSRIQIRAEQLGVNSLTGAGITTKRLQQETAKDGDLQEIKKAVETGQWKALGLGNPDHKRSLLALKDEILTKDGLVFREGRIIPPGSLRLEILEAAHQGHPGIVRTKGSLRQSYWWPGMDSFTERFIRTCVGCQISSKSKPAGAVEHTSIPAPKKPAAQWAIDITGPFWNNRYLVVLIDYFSKYPEVLDTKDITSGAIIKFLQNMFDRHGNPEALVSDNGPQFISFEFTEFLKQKDIHHYRTSVYNPQENGLVEAFNKTLKHGIQAMGETPWTEGIRKLLHSYRTTPTSTTGKPPVELLSGRPFRTDWMPNLSKPMRQTRELQTQHSGTKGPQDQQEHRPYLGPSQFRRGEKVLSRLPWVPKGKSPWSTPKTVIRVLGSRTFLLSDNQVWNGRNLKPWRTPQDINRDKDWDEDAQPANRNQDPRRSLRANKGIPPKRYGINSTRFPVSDGGG